MAQATIRLATGRQTTPASPSFDLVPLLSSPPLPTYVGSGSGEVIHGLVTVSPVPRAARSLDLAAGPVPVEPSSMKLS